MRKLARRQWWTVIVVVAVGLLIVILGLIAAGILVLPPTGPPAPVKISTVCVTWEQGKNASGNYWFGQNNYCYGDLAHNLPYSAAPGSTVVIPVEVLNYDSVSHTIYSAQVAPPFSVASTSPPLPYIVTSINVNPEGIDGGLLVYTVLPNSPGATLSVNVTVNALGAP
jgi:hypothetical protein